MTCGASSGSLKMPAAGFDSLKDIASKLSKNLVSRRLSEGQRSVMCLFLCSLMLLLKSLVVITNIRRSAWKSKVTGSIRLVHHVFLNIRLTRPSPLLNSPLYQIYAPTLYMYAPFRCMYAPCLLHVRTLQKWFRVTRLGLTAVYVTPQTRYLWSHIS